MTQTNTINLDDCWLYAGYIDPNGYGAVFSGGKHYRAHRVMYEALVGEIPPELHVDHLCRVTQCINPIHLEPVTCRENVLRGISPSALNAQKTHCVNGHEFTPDNVWVRQRYRGKDIADRKYRQCLTCNRENSRRMWEKSKAKVQ